MRILISDDAKQFRHLADESALCWIHEVRHYKELSPVAESFVPSKNLRSSSVLRHAGTVVDLPWSLKEPVQRGVRLYQAMPRLQIEQPTLPEFWSDLFQIVDVLPSSKVKDKPRG